MHALFILEMADNNQSLRSTALLVHMSRVLYQILNINIPSGSMKGQKSLWKNCLWRQYDDMGTIINLSGIGRNGNRPRSHPLVTILLNPLNVAPQHVRMSIVNNGRHKVRQLTYANRA